MVAITRGTTPTTPDTTTTAAAPAAKPVVPGFNAKGQPLPDDKVWNLFIGPTKRPVNTAQKPTLKLLDGWEKAKLAKLAQDNPQEFLQRLLADSSNGTPFGFDVSRTIKNLGVAKLDVKAKDGKIDASVTLNVFNKRADGYLKAYMAKDGREKGTRSSLKLGVTGDLNKAGGIDNIDIEVSADNLPKLDAAKLSKLDQLQKRLKKTLKAKDMTKAEKNDAIMWLFEDAVDELSDFPIPFFLNLITGYNVLDINIKEKGKKMKGHAELGDGKYSVKLTDILADYSKDEPRIGATIAGAADDDGIVSIDEASIGTDRPLSLSWSEDGKPSISEKNPKTGKSRELNDHFGELPLVLGFLAAGAPDIF